MISILVWAAFGLVAGLLAKAIMPGKDPGGFIVTILIGVAGAILGGYISQLLGFANDGQVSFLSPKDWIFAIVGALIILFVWKKFLAPKFAKKKSE